MHVANDIEIVHGLGGAVEPGTETFLPVKFCDWRGGLKGLILQFERL